MKNLVIKYSIILTVAYLITYWTLYLSPWDIPTHIPTFVPDAPISVDGLLWFIMVGVTFRFFQKQALKLHPATRVFNLIILSTLICFSMEVIFHFIKLFIQQENNVWDYIFYFFLGVIASPILSLIISVPMAFRLKNKDTRLVYAIIVVIIIGVYYIMANSLHH